MADQQSAMIRRPSREYGELDVPAAVREQWDEQMLLVIRNTVARDAPIPMFHLFLAQSNKLGLDPLNKEIWLAKMNNRDGDAAQWAIIVARDGFLRKGDENPRYRGFDARPVYANDEFAEGDPRPSAKTLRGRAGIKHRAGHPKDRGELVGAFCIVEMVNVDGSRRPPFYFFAGVDEYKPSGRKLEFSPWGKTLTVMALKAAISTAHRHALNLSGVVGEGEHPAAIHPDARDELAVAERAAITVGGHPVAIPDDTETGKRLQGAYDRAREVCPADWTPAKMRARLDSLAAEHADDAEAYDAALSALADAVEADVATAAEALTGEVEHPDPEAIDDSGDDADAATEADVVDGAVVAGEVERAEAQADAEAAEVDRLRHRLADLEALGDDVEPDKAAEVLAEIEHLDEELRRRGVDPSAGPPSGE